MMRGGPLYLMSSLAALLLCTVPGVVPSGKVPTREITRLFNADQEKLLREEIAQRNAQIDKEGKYAIADGANFDKLDIDETKDQAPEADMDVIADMESTPGDGVKDKNSLAARIERITKPRAFPLFIAEKAIEFVEESIADITKAVQRSSAGANGVGTKEKIVVLGSGWGAVSFIKGIDTDLYDITVISPRNHFTFTPMLVRRRIFALSNFSVRCVRLTILILNTGWSQRRYRRIPIHYTIDPRSEPKG